MEDLLDQLGDEAECKKRDLEVERNLAVDAMCRGLEAVLLAYAQNPSMIFDDGFSIYQDSRPAQYSAEDVGKFSVVLGKYQSRKHFGSWAGWYLSMLIHDCPDGVTIITEHLDTELDSLGWKNRDSRFVVRNNVGDYLGNHMFSGTIIVHGNAGHDVGYGMSGGEIRINGNAGMFVSCKNGKILIDGNAGESLGYRMDCGEITVLGDVEDKLGSQMRKGAIHVGGDYKSLATDIQGGDIYHKGNLIVKDGKKV